MAYEREKEEEKEEEEGREGCEQVPGGSERLGDLLFFLRCAASTLLFFVLVLPHHQSFSKTAQSIYLASSQTTQISFCHSLAVSLVTASHLASFTLSKLRKLAPGTETLKAAGQAANFGDPVGEAIATIQPPTLYAS